MQYPLVELATGALFALIGGASIDVFIKILYLCIASLLVIIFVYDLYHTIIPDEWVYTFAAFSFVSALVLLFPLLTFDVLLLTIMAGPITAFPLFALWFISRGRWMGLGDPKLALGIGWLLGVPYGLSAVFLAFVIGGVVSVCILLPFQYIVHITSEIPPVPFVAVLQFGRRMSSLAKMMYKNDPRQWKEYLRKIRQQQGQRITHLGPARTGFTMKSEVPFGPFLIASCCLIWFAMMYGVRIPFIL
jgi:leader peptidase (prepilin peptidase)/N-methyltransferase